MRDGLGKSIPIMKFMEVLGDMSNDFGKLSPTFDWIDNTMIPILSDVERKGIQVDRKKFFDRWKDNKKSLWFSRTFTEYNPYTITSRPSNRHLGINFWVANLSKKDKSREIFIPQEGKKFVQFDYVMKKLKDSGLPLQNLYTYHVRIIGFPTS